MVFVGEALRLPTSMQMGVALQKAPDSLKPRRTGAWEKVQVHCLKQCVILPFPKPVTRIACWWRHWVDEQTKMGLCHKPAGSEMQWRSLGPVCQGSQP